MKTLVAASLLLALVVPAHASRFRESDRKWLPTVNEWAEMAWPCMKGQGDEDNETYEVFRAKACKIMRADQDRLIANGYCVFANGGIGRPGRDRKHCYTINWPSH